MSVTCQWRFWHVGDKKRAVDQVADVSAIKKTLKFMPVAKKIADNGQDLGWASIVAEVMTMQTKLCVNEL